MARPDLFLRLAFCLVVLSSVLSQAPKDPLEDFCRRFSHQTALINRRLYIDGGYVNADSLSQNPRSVTNPNLLVQNLDIITQDGMPVLSANLSKDATVPIVSGGILWTDEVNQVFYLFGGEYPDVPDEFALWVYDVPLDQWNLTVESSSSSGIQRVAWGGGTTVEGRAEGYYYGGYLDDHTTPGWDAPRTATNTLVRYDMTANSWSNRTGPDDISRAEGVMVTIPASRQGLLIYFGGVSFSNQSSTEEPSPMSTIFLYDIAEDKWYQQNTTGEIPENRRKFCAGATWAQDQSSYNIYIYGGAGFAENATGFDDVYILTLPSFTWIKWYPTEPGPGSPHNSLTCNVVENAQMLIIGGTFPESDICDAPDVWGTHNLDLGKNNPTQAKWNLFNPNLTTYEVPSEIVSVVGGGSTGGATAEAPAGGWDHRDLPIYFQQQATYAARTPTRAIPTNASAPDQGNESNRNAIIGGVVGGVVGILLLGGLIVFCLWRRKKRKPKKTPNMIQSSQQSSSGLNHNRTGPTGPSMPSPSAPSSNLPTYLEQKPFPSATTTLTRPSTAAPSLGALDHSYTSTPATMVATHSHHAPVQSPALDQGSVFTQLSPPLPSPTYQHPAHSQPSQQQPYFPPPPTREYVDEAENAPTLREQHSATYEMPGVSSPKPSKKTWNG